MKSGLYMTPGEPATCSAAVRAIWLARPGTSVSKVRAGLRRLRDGIDEEVAVECIAPFAPALPCALLRNAPGSRARPFGSAPASGPDRGATSASPVARRAPAVIEVAAVSPGR